MGGETRLHRLLPGMVMKAIFEMSLGAWRKKFNLLDVVGAQDSRASPDLITDKLAEVAGIILDSALPCDFDTLQISVILLVLGI